MSTVHADATGDARVELTRAHLGFVLAVQEALAPEGTIVWSPFSVASALALLARGAESAAKAEIVALLLGGKGDQLEGLVRLLGRAGQVTPPHAGQDQPEIAVSNTFWVDTAITVRARYAAALTATSSGEIRSAPFVADSQAARQAINQDVAKTTRDLIPKLLGPGTIHEDTVAMLVSALYLKTGWLCPFDQPATEDRPFSTPAGMTLVPTMALDEELGYARTAGWQVVALRAAGGVEAVILVPDGQLSVDAATLEHLLAAPEPRQVSLRMPRLTLSLQTQLAKVLGQLGVREIFTDEASLTGISADPLAVQAVLHESVLNLDENGIEGAAATAVVDFMSLAGQSVQVDVDKPFLLVVRNIETGVVYFSARVTDPS